MQTGIVEVSINQIPVGVIDKTALEAIRALAHEDWRLWLTQSWHVISAVWRLLSRALLFAFQLAGALPLVLACLYPGELSDAIRLAASDPAALQRMAQSMAWLIFVLTVPALVLGGLRLHVRSAFDERVAQRLRRRLNVPADGEVSWRELAPGEVPTTSAQR